MGGRGIWHYLGVLGVRWFVRWLLIKQRQLVCNHDDLEVHEIGSFETYQTCKRCGKCGKLGDF